VGSLRSIVRLLLRFRRAAAVVRLFIQARRIHWAREGLLHDVVPVSAHALTHADRQPEHCTATLAPISFSSRIFVNL